MSPRTKNAKPSGRFLLRLDPGLHAALRAAAAEAAVSLNDYCARKLALPVGNHVALAGARAVVERAAALFGEELVGVVAYGSWVRAEATASSDVDVLVVLEETTELRRALYRRWDEEPLRWDGLPVEAHFVHLRTEAEPPSGVWAEAAIDGVVLFERGLRISARLVAIRRDIVAGRLVRRTAHGQPYWAEAT